MYSWDVSLIYRGFGVRITGIRADLHVAIDVTM